MPSTRRLLSAIHTDAELVGSDEVAMDCLLTLAALARAQNTSLEINGSVRSVIHLAQKMSTISCFECPAHSEVRLKHFRLYQQPLPAAASFLSTQHHALLGRHLQKCFSSRHFLLSNASVSLSSCFRVWVQLVRSELRTAGSLTVTPH